MFFRQYSFFKYLFQALLSSASAAGWLLLAQIWTTYENLEFPSTESFIATLRSMTLGALSFIGITFALSAFILAWLSDEGLTRRKKNLMLGAGVPFIINLFFLLKTVLS